MEPSAEFLGGKETQSPEFFEDRERNVFVLWINRELLEPANLFFGQPPETRSNRPCDGLPARFEILAVESRQALSIESLIHLLKGLLQRKAIFLNQLPQLSINDLE